MTIDLSPIAGAWPFLAKALGVTVFVNLASVLVGFVTRPSGRRGPGL
jgi:hypothetical protein